MTISRQSPSSLTVRTFVPSCNTNRSVDALSGELLTETDALITTASVLSSSSRRSVTANEVEATKTSSIASVP